MTRGGQTSSGPECGFGALGICCQHCGLGPCRLNPFSQEPKFSKCGLSADTIVLRNYLTRLALGASSFAGYGEKLIQQVLSQEKQGKAVKIARKALKDFAGRDRRVCAFLESQLSPKQLARLSQHEIAPHGIRESILDLLYELSSAAAETEDITRPFMKGITASLAGLAAINIIRTLEGLLGDTSFSTHTSFCESRKAKKQETSSLEEIVEEASTLIARGKCKGLSFIIQCDPHV